MMDRSHIKELDSQYIVHTYNRYDVVVDHASGAVVTDANGKEYVDFCSGYAANSLGYQNEAWLDAVIGQLKKVQHASNLYYTEPGPLLAEKLVTRSGLCKVWFANSGGEANEAAIKTAKEDRSYITQADIRASFVKVGIGSEKRSKIISDEEKKITAYHEAGHAILFHVLPGVGPVYSISIIPTGMGAAGYTMPLPEKDEMFRTRSRMLNQIIVDLGGRMMSRPGHPRISSRLRSLPGGW